MHSMMLLSASLTILSMLTGAMHVPFTLQNHKSKVVIGYVQDYPDSPTPALDQIDFKKITHLNVAFANPVDADGNLSVPPSLVEIVARAHQNDVKVLISIAGGGVSANETEQAKYFTLISSKNRKAFVQRIVHYLELYHLDGLDVDLEGPAINKDYASFVSELAAAIKPKHKLLTAAVSAWFGGDQITEKALGYFDLVNVMAYDATGPWDKNKPGQHSSMDYTKKSVDYWIDRGVPKSKLVLGVPFYGYGFGDAFTKDGYTFAQIVSQYPGSEAKDEVGHTIWYNGIPTIRAKVKYVREQHLAGVMIWSIDQDAKGEQSLLSAIHDSLLNK
jgi:chitinase